MTITATDGPLITIGAESALGSPTTIVGATGAPGPYVSGVSENPDAGPNAFFAGSMFKDMRYRYKRGGGGVQAGGYPNQALGFIDQQLATIDLVPSSIATANIAALAAPTLNIPMTLVAVSGAGITVETAAQTILATGNVVPTGVLRIDAVPGWVSYGASGAMRGWNCAAVGRAVSLTSASNLSGLNFTIRGYDVYGAPMTQTLAGPNNNTVNTTKCFKWIASVTPSATNAGTVSVGTADIFEFPLLVRRFSQVEIWWNEAAITANTGFVTADTTSPATVSTGDTRGSYAVQSASDGVKRLEVTQRILPADIATLTAVFGQIQV